MASSDDQAVEASARAWIESHKEIADMNQYWYSPASIAMMVGAIRRHCLGAADGAAGPPLDCAFLSTPSLFFALDAAERARSRVLDYDTQLGSEAEGVLFYDYNQPLALPAALKGAFRAVVIDPPFITRDVWQLYAQTARWLLAPGGGVVIATTVVENARLIAELLGAHPNRWLPSIPHLPYQYALYTSFRDDAALARPNAEVPLEPDELLRDAGEGQALDQSRARAAERPVGGAGNGYDFEAMIEKAMRAGGPP
jgi:hypothetical protein